MSNMSGSHSFKEITFNRVQYTTTNVVEHVPMRILLRVSLDCGRNASITVAFPQDGIDGTAHDFCVPLVNVPFFVILGLGGWIQGHIVTLGSEFRNAIQQLIQWSGNVG